MRRLAVCLLFACLGPVYLSSSVLAETPSQEQVEQDAQGDDKPIGGESGKKGGIYVVGRGFKTAGHEMEKGFKAAGRGIVKGANATGRGFKKAGGAVKDFFTGESGEKKEK